jgi:hypothetical protein
MVIRAMPTKRDSHKKEQEDYNLRSVSAQQKLSRTFTTITDAADSREKPSGSAQGELLWLKFKLERRNRDLATSPWCGRQLLHRAERTVNSAAIARKRQLNFDVPSSGRGRPFAGK